jgi:hypothetical protein
VVLSVEQWTRLCAEFEEVERHATMAAGDLLLIRTVAGLAAVEQPNSDERVIRLLGGTEEARRFVGERLALYERMWDGCGCKIDYYS